MKTALVAIGRRENQYAREWVEHHLTLGFDHIYIYDNNHDGEELFIDVLMDYVEQGRVTIIDYRNQEKAQRPAYNDAYQRLSGKYGWLAFFDFDEFLVLPCRERQGSAGTTSPSGEKRGVASFLATIPQDYHAVMIPWVMMTDSGLVHNDGRPLMERFTESTTRGEQQGKCIIRTGIPGARFTKSVHVPYTPTLRCCNPKGEPTAQHRLQPRDTDVAYLKHFSTKTIEEWLKNKWKKGAAGVSYEKFQRQYQDYFFRINERTPEKEAYIKFYKQ
jgi:hypothetical protein